MGSPAPPPAPLPALPWGRGASFPGAPHPHLPPGPAASKRDCLERFGARTLERITRDDDVICTTEYSRIVPLENGEVGPVGRAGRRPVAALGRQPDHAHCLQVVVSLVNRRPGAMNFSYSPLLRDFTKATNIRLRFLRTNTLLGHLMGKALRDPTVTRRVSTRWVCPWGSGPHGLAGRDGMGGRPRAHGGWAQYYYSIKDISIGGRCVCHGHADVCDAKDPTDPFR